MIYIFSKSDLSIKQITKPIEYNIKFDEETNGKSTFKIERQTEIISGDIVYFKPYYLLIDNVEGEKNINTLTLTCVDLVNLFDREVLETDIELMSSNSLEYFIGEMILKNYVQPNDPILAIPYVNISILTNTATVEPTNSQNFLYNLKTFITNCRQNKNICVDFEIIKGEQNLLQINIQKKEFETVLIDTTVAEVTDYKKVYDMDVVAKVECLNRETDEYSYLYLRADRTTTSDSSDPLRVVGATKSISIDADPDGTTARNEMINVFKENSYNHLIEFKIKKSSKLVDVSSLRIGSVVKIKTNDGIYDSYISAIEFNDEEFVSFKTGQIRVSLTDKLSQQKLNLIGNKVDVKTLPAQIIKSLDLIGFDFVIEVGTSGIWTYRKWNSGKAECWGTYTVTGKTMNTAWGNGLYISSVNSSRINYPFTFLERPKEYATTHTSAVACFMFTESGGNGLNTTSASAMYSIARPSSSSSSVTAYLDLRVVGNWK